MTESTLIFVILAALFFLVVWSVWFAKEVRKLKGYEISNRRMNTNEYRSPESAKLWALGIIVIVITMLVFNKYSAFGKPLPQASNSVSKFIPTPASQVSKLQTVCCQVIADVPAIGDVLAGCTITDRQYVICEDGEKIIYMDKSLLVYVDGQWTLTTN